MSGDVLSTSEEPRPMMRGHEKAARLSSVQTLVKASAEQ